MSNLREELEFAAATVGAFGQISVRIDHVIYSGVTEVARRAHRHVLMPGDSLDGEHENVRAIAVAIWTPETLENYRVLRAADTAARSADAVQG
jgi:hypothetical protein